MAAPLAFAKADHIRHTKVHRTRRRLTHRATAPAQCANANAAATSASVDAMRAAVVCLINQRRSERGLPSLTVSSRLNSSAQAWNNVMVSANIFTHGTNFAGRISAVGYDWQYAGENIATGYPTPSAVVRAWMASPDHCRNILDPHFRNVGTGESPAGIASQQSGRATWTQDFGLQMGQSPPSSHTGPQNGCPY
jgi:uncharacterized protein YkwD